MTFVCLNMNGRAQFYMNLGLTFMIGDYGIISALYSELTKPVFEQKPKLLAFDFFALLVLASITITILQLSLREIEAERASSKR